jgi:hypothetical protein
MLQAIEPALPMRGGLAAAYAEDSSRAGAPASVIGHVLRLARLPRDVSPQDLAPALKAFGAKRMDMPHPGECLVELESLEAVVIAFEVLPAWLGAAGYGRVGVMFASGTGEGCACWY